MIKFLEDFEYKGYPCLVLEILHTDLYDLVDRSNGRIQLSKIRTIAKQVCVMKTLDYQNKPIGISLFLLWRTFKVVLFPVGVHSLGRPQPCQDFTRRCQTRQHHACQQRWPEGETDRLRHGLSRLRGLHRDRRAASPIQVFYITSPSLELFSFCLLTFNWLLAFPHQGSRSAPRPAVQLRHWHVGNGLRSHVPLPQRGSFHCLQWI